MYIYRYLFWNTEFKKINTVDVHHHMRWNLPLIWGTVRILSQFKSFLISDFALDPLQLSLFSTMFLPETIHFSNFRPGLCFRVVHFDDSRQRQFREKDRKWSYLNFSFYLVLDLHRFTIRLWCEIHRRYRWHRWLTFIRKYLPANFRKNSKRPQGNTYGPGGHWFMKKPEVENLVSDSL